MPKITLKIESKNTPTIEAQRKCETVADVSKLFALAQKQLRTVTRIFPALKNARVERVSVSTH